MFIDSSVAGRIQCMSISEGSIRSVTDRFMDIAGKSNHDDKILIVAAFGVEEIPPIELKRLDFLFRIHERTFKHSSILLLLMWNSDNKAIEGDSNDSDSEMSGDSTRNFQEKRFLTQEWSRGGHLVNGAALVGRLTNFVHCQRCEDESLLTEQSPLDFCLSPGPDPDPDPSDWKKGSKPTFLVGIFVTSFLLGTPFRQYMRLVLKRMKMFLAELGMTRLLH